MRKTITLALVASFPWVTRADALLLQPAQVVQAGAAALNPGSQSIPCMADWNGDGLPDLLLGYQPSFKIAVYPNSGTSTGPVFTTASNIKGGGTDIYLPATGCGSPAPWVCDYDGDGRRDLLAGAGADGKVWFYRNTNTDSAPILASGVALLKSGTQLSTGIRATPYTHDWDEDGLPDLLCGDGNGNVHLFKNSGTRQAPVYTNDVLIQAGGVALNLGLRSTVRMCDWDGDGLKDVIGSGMDNAAWCRNTGNNSSPLFASPVRLQAPVTGSGLANIDTGYRMRLDLTDWDQDGVIDLLIGNSDGYVYLYPGYCFCLRTPRLPAVNQCVLSWNSAAFLKYTVLGGTSVNQVLSVLASNVASGGRETCWTNAAGEAGGQFYRVQLVK